MAPAPFRPLTFWLPERNSPSLAAIIISGLAISAAIVAMGILWTRRTNQSPKRKSLALGLIAAGVAVVLLFAAQIYWERIVNRYRRPNRPEFDRPRASPRDQEADS
jgi:hypothetical protein